MIGDSSFASLPSWSKAQAWLFDFDNTLAALEPEVDWAASRVELEAFLRDEGVGPAIFAEFPKGNLVLYEALRSRLTDSPTSPHLVTEGGLARRNPFALLRHASAIIEAFELRGVCTATEVPGARDLLRILHSKSRPIAIVTSNSSRTTTSWLQRERLDSGLTAVVGRDAMLPLKPAPTSVVRALGLCSVRAADAIFVGDAPTDFQAAVTAGVRFIGIATTPTRRARLIEAGASTIVSSLVELGSYVKKLPTE